MHRNITAAMLRGYPDLLDVGHIQKILQIGRSTAYNLLKSGELRSLRIGTIYRIPKTFLIDFMRNSA